VAETADGMARAQLSRRSVLKYGSIGAAALGLAACSSAAKPGATGGSGAGAGKSGTLTIWTWAGASVLQAGFNAVKATSKDFAGFKANIQTVAANDYATAEKFSLALSGGTALPDILQLNYTEMPQFAAAGVLEELSSAYAPYSADLYAGALQVAKYNGSFYAFPGSLNPKLFYYRSDLFAEAKIDPSSIQTTDDYIAAGMKFQRKFPGQHIMNLNTEPQPYVFGEMISAYAPISFASTDGKYQITSNPGFEQVFTFLRQIHDSQIAYPVDDFTTDWPSAIKNQKVCGYLGADWVDEFLPGYATLSQAGKWKAIPWPKLSPMANQEYGSDAGGSLFVVPKGAANSQAAIEFLKQWRLAPDGSLASFNANGILPLNRTTAPSVISSLRTAKRPQSTSQTAWRELPQHYFGPDYIATKLEAMNRVKVFGYDPKAVKEWSSIVSDWLTKLLSGSASVSAALAGMQQDMQTQVSNPYSAG
jgi:ABC-type glycerol-3-phosphate transport system substrate-binding protein